MEEAELIQICDERLGKWKEVLRKEHATPILLLGVGHDHMEKHITICTTEDMDTGLINGFLRYAIGKLETTR